MKNDAEHKELEDDDDDDDDYGNCGEGVAEDGCDGEGHFRWCGDLRLRDLMDFNETDWMG